MMTKFYKKTEFFVFFIFPIIAIAIFGTFAKELPRDIFFSREQTIFRIWNEIERCQTESGKSYVIHVMLKNNDELPVLDWNPDIDYYLIYPNGQPTNSPHTTKIHFDLMAHMLDTGITLYKGKSIDHPLGPCVKPCPICRSLLNHDK